MGSSIEFYVMVESRIVQYSIITNIWQCGHDTSFLPYRYHFLFAAPPSPAQQTSRVLSGLVMPVIVLDY